MKASKTTLTLILPGLSEVSAVDMLGRCARLHKLTGRASESVTRCEGYEQSLMHAMGYDIPGRAGLPGAQCSYLTDFNESAPWHCARADPVFLRTEQNHARLVSAECLALDAQDAHTIITDLNSHFDGDGLYFSMGQKDRWYVSGKPSAGLDSAPTTLVAGRNVASFLPHAREATPWRQLATEVQMLLHTHPVNEKRSSAGLMPVNALWFWGAGKLERQTVSSDYRLFSNSAFALGLGSLTGITAFPLQDVHSALSSRLVALLAMSNGGRSTCRNIIVVHTDLLEAILTGDTARQATALAVLEAGVLRYAEQLLKRGLIRRVRIDTCDGRAYLLSRRQLFQFWIRKSVLQARDENSAASGI